MNNKTQEVIDSATDMASQVGDFLVDSFCDNEIIQRIPVVGTVISLFKFGKSISDSIFLYKLKMFIDNLDSVDESWKDRFSNENECRQIAREVVYVVNSTIDERKIKIFSIIFCKYVNGVISREEFHNSYDILNKANYDLLLQITRLEERKEYSFMDISGDIKLAYYHWISLGLMEQTSTLTEFGNRYILSKYGFIFKSILSGERIS